MAAIKKLFEKTKLEFKFKKAGEGHKLTDRNPSAAAKEPAKTSQFDATNCSKELTDERKMAAEAALARFNQKKETRGSSKYSGSMRAQMMVEKREMEAALAQAKKYSSSPKEVNLDSCPIISGVFFKCPITGSDEARPKEIMEHHIEEFLYSQLTEEPQLTSALMIRTLNKNQEQMKSCIETLSKYLINILENPDKEIYKRIKSSNKILNERVLNCRGALEFLQATGFELKKLKLDDNKEDEFYVLDVGQEDRNELADKLRSLLEILQVSEPIKMELYRDIKVFSPSQKDVSKFHVPDEFYAMTPEELKREHKLKEEALKGLEQFKTKELRERERLRELRRYRYSAIRVRFPDGFMVQGTFRANDTFASVRQFIADSLELDWMPFNLSAATGHKITEDGKTIAELNLAPASLLQFSFDQNVIKEISQQSDTSTNKYLKDELMQLALQL